MFVSHCSIFFLIHRTDKNVLNCLKHICLSHKSRGIQNNVTQTRGEWTIMREERKENVTQYCIQGKFRPHFIFALFALWPEGEFKAGLIQSFIKDFVGKLVSGRIQDWVNQSHISIGENKTRRIQSCIQHIVFYIHISLFFMPRFHYCKCRA